MISWDAKNLIEEVKKMRDEEFGTEIPNPPEGIEVHEAPPATHLAWTEPNDLKIAQLNQENAKLKAKILRLEKVIDKMTELRELERRLP